MVRMQEEHHREQRVLQERMFEMQSTSKTVTGHAPTASPGDPRYSAPDAPDATRASAIIIGPTIGGKG